MRDEEQRLTPLPFYYLEIAYALLKDARDDLESAPEVSALVEEIRYVRTEKLGAGVHAINEGSETIAFLNIASMELAQVRGYIPFVLRAIGRMNRDVDAAATQPERK